MNPEQKQTPTAALSEAERMAAVGQELTDLVDTLTAAGQNIIAPSQKDYNNNRTTPFHVQCYTVHKRIDEETQVPTYTIVTHRTNRDMGAEKLILSPNKQPQLIERDGTEHEHTSDPTLLDLADTLRKLKAGRALIPGKEVLRDGQVYRKRSLRYMSRFMIDSWNEGSPQDWE